MDVSEFLSQRPVLLLFVLIGIGMLVGRIKIYSVSLGPSAVLFAALALAALGDAQGTDILISPELGTAGLVIFTFAIGNSAGPTFFENIRTAVGPMVTVLVGLVLVGAVTLAVGHFVFDMDIALIAGTYAGAMTNTPALAAAGETAGAPATAAVGYSLAYIFGTLGAMAAAAAAIKNSAKDTDTPEPITEMTIEVTRTDQPRLGDVLAKIAHPIEVSRLRRGRTGPVWIPTETDVILEKDFLIVVGLRSEVKELVDMVGRESSNPLREDRRFLDFWNIAVSRPQIAGMTIRDAGRIVLERYGGVISRVSRGDQDMIPMPDFMLDMGDRVRVIAPTAQLKRVSRFFGNSELGMTQFSPVALGLGIALGMMLGEIQIPLPGGSTFSIGHAAGGLMMGLIFGRIGRIGQLVTAFPAAAGSVLAEIGLLVFLAQAGTNAGGQVGNAFRTGQWVSIFALGLIATTTLAAFVYASMRLIHRMGGTQLAGVLGGAQTHAAVLAFANARTQGDPRVALGYSLIYPAAMIGKIMVATMIAMFTL